ncbi:MAG: hypothetical protein J7K00_01075 [Candidatus Diapherotrites archaeon]|nr:hypothetical protein [Candidatus Diapherotrites archaeon]
MSEEIPEKEDEQFTLTDIDTGESVVCTVPMLLGIGPEKNKFGAPKKPLTKKQKLVSLLRKLIKKI